MLFRSLLFPFRTTIRHQNYTLNVGQVLLIDVQALEDRSTVFNVLVVCGNISILLELTATYPLEALNKKSLTQMPPFPFLVE